MNPRSPGFASGLGSSWRIATPIRIRCWIVRPGLQRHPHRHSYWNQFSLNGNNHVPVRCPPCCRVAGLEADASPGDRRGQRPVARPDPSPDGGSRPLADLSPTADRTHLQPAALSWQRDRVADGVPHGTHVDAPRHFFLDGPGFDEIPLERLYGPGVVLRIEAEADQPITAETLARFDDQILPGDIVLLDTDWARRVADEAYEDHPYLTADAAEWLLDRGIRMLGVDFSTPDLGARLRPAGFDYPVHKILLGHGILIAEHLANLRPLAGHRIEAMLLGLPVAGSDGGPARAVARLA
ncbi:MAG: hypothetical protein DI544_11185 [Sphingomonas taxi]|uniref:Cyclase n=1 Tax=Sphingomonas taxi TaxID=1549858 RepID=A0A2W5P1J3_9SPHN|nr:MAG: hypothetical protein DI544_11185 [Sphingomonas taxi]